jgi:hypothetical protein
VSGTHQKCQSIVIAFFEAHPGKWQVKGIPKYTDIVETKFLRRDLNSRRDLFKVLEGRLAESLLELWLILYSRRLQDYGR